MKLFIAQGSEYDPGWHVYRENSERNYSSLATLDNEEDALEELAHLKNYYESYGEQVELVDAWPHHA